MVITLIGYRGSGKTSVAPLLARRLDCEWIDSDGEIECRAARTIREIFASEGEPRFRELEREVLADLLSRDRLVIAAGGGAVLDAGTRSRMQAAGPVVWLTASPETLFARFNRDATTPERRPNLTTAGGLDEVCTVLRQREPLYRQTAALVIDTEDTDPEAVVERIISVILTGPRPDRSRP